MGYLILIVVFFGLVFALVAISAVLGLLTALYVFRPKVLHLIATDLGGSFSLLAQIAVGFTLAAFVPLVGGVAYALSGAPWMTKFFGALGHMYWAWVAGAFVLGLGIGSILRPTT